MSKRSQLPYYLRRHLWLPSILAFLAFLILGAVFLLLGKASEANEFGVLAFYALALGIALQLLAILTEGKHDSSSDDGPAPSAQGATTS
ncbi:MAG TPA: hypothetical protein VNA15_09060 [Candidatus Angelobacter sp.]|nr:hypothetical protein [Candidatus Angelobacter sp.]